MGLLYLFKHGIENMAKKQALSFSLLQNG
jgi:hypothetical protein